MLLEGALEVLDRDDEIGQFIGCGRRIIGGIKEGAGSVDGGVTALCQDARCERVQAKLAFERGIGFAFRRLAPQF